MSSRIGKLQLEMVRLPRPVPPARPLPPGYVLRQFEERDRGSYWRLFARVFDTRSRLDDLRTQALTGGFFVTEHVQSGEVVSSAVAAIYPHSRHPAGASLQWVMTHETHTGQGLGAVAVAAATAKLAETGGRAYLNTDDWRLPAISIYLRLGWQPFLFEPEMEPRWQAVFASLGRPFSADECAT